MKSFILPKNVILKKSARWQPKKWKPIYEEIVLLSAGGKSNEEIAENLGYTSQQISNILGTPQAKETLSKISSRAREHFQVTFSERVEVLADRALSNMEKVLTEDKYLEAAPMAMFDRSLTFAKAAGKLSGDSPKNTQTTNIVIGSDVQRTLIEGLQKANKVLEVHGGYVSEKKQLAETTGKSPTTSSIP